MPAVVTAVKSATVVTTATVVTGVTSVEVVTEAAWPATDLCATIAECALRSCSPTHPKYNVQCFVEIRYKER